MRLSQAMPFPEPGYRPKRWPRVVAALGAVFVVAMIANVSYQDETRVSSCICGNTQDERIIRVCGIPLYHTARIELHAPVKIGHVHQWHYFGGCTDYGFGGRFGASCVN